MSLYLGNDTRYSHSYNGIRIAYAIYRLLPFPITLSDPWPRFQGHDILQRQVTRKWYKIELYTQQKTDRKSYMIYRIVQF